MTPVDAEDFRRLVEAIKPGPFWKAETELAYGSRCTVKRASGAVVCDTVIDRNDADLIAFLFSHADALLALVEADAKRHEMNRAVLLARVAELEAALTQPAAVEDGELAAVKAERNRAHRDCELLAKQITILVAERDRMKEAAKSALGCLDDPTGGTHVEDMRRASDALRAALGEQP